LVCCLLIVELACLYVTMWYDRWCAVRGSARARIWSR